MAKQVRYAVGSRLTYWIGEAFRRGDLHRFSATWRALVRISGIGALRVCLAPMEKRMVQLFGAAEADRRRDSLQAEDRAYAHQEGGALR